MPWQHYYNYIVCCPEWQSLSEQSPLCGGYHVYKDVWSAAFVRTLLCQQKRFNPQDSCTVAVIKYDTVVAPFMHLSTLKDLNSTILLMPKVNILRGKFSRMAIHSWKPWKFSPLKKPAINISNKHCFVAYCTFHSTPYITNWILSNNSWFM